MSADRTPGWTSRGPGEITGGSGSSMVTAGGDTGVVSSRDLLAESEALWRVVLDNSSDHIMRFGPGARIEYVNKRLVELTGIRQEDWIGKTAAEVGGYPPEVTHIWEDDVRQVFETGEPASNAVQVPLPGGLRWIEYRLEPEFGPDGSVEHVISMSSDATERRAAEARLRESDALLTVAVEGSRDGTAIYGPDLRIEYVNHRAVELSGIPAPAWVGRSMEEMGYPESSVAFWTANIREVFASGEPRSMEYEVDNTEGHRWYEGVLSPQLGSDGSVAHVVSTNRDITDRVLAERALRDLATHDSLTGLANRRAVLDELDRGLKAARRTAGAIGVLIVDLDRFKNVNDSLGHDVGDTLLTLAARRLATAVRGGDLFGRLGGDEFVVVMRDLNEPAEALRVAWRLVETCRRPFAGPDGEMFSTASVGVAISGAESQPSDLLREADTAMYAAKDDGRDRVALYNDELREAVANRLTLEADLRHALELDQLAVWFQPEVDLVTGRVIAAEALLRWNHPSGETLSAESFIGIAEETGLIHEIGDWVLRQACTQAASWGAGNHGNGITVRVNVSARQLGEVGLLDAIDEAVSISGLDPVRLCLEITETGLLNETATALDNLSGIHERGLQVALDDFGTGYASLTYLHRYTIEVLKIDRSFVTNITISLKDYQLVSGLIALAARLQLRVTAEGVESLEQADCLKELGCPSAQGYLFSEAIPPEQFVTLLDQRFPTGTDAT